MDYKVKRVLDTAIGFWTIIVNGEVTLECLSDKEKDQLTDEEAIYWYEWGKTH